jgi:hypothetical protein
MKTNRTKQIILMLRLKGQYHYDDSHGTIVVQYQNRHYLVMNDNYYEEHQDTDSAVNTALKISYASAERDGIIIV